VSVSGSFIGLREEIPVFGRKHKSPRSPISRLPKSLRLRKSGLRKSGKAALDPSQNRNRSFIGREIH
jgi:hypothetical protein